MSSTVRITTLTLVFVLACLGVASYKSAGKRERAAPSILPERTGGKGPDVPSPLVYLSPLWNAKCIVVGKEMEKLFLYVSHGDRFGLVEAFNVTTGQRGGDKIIEGDLKTPEGIYFPMQELDGRGIGDEYGVLAYTLDYPNIWDRREQKGGSGIWLHATNEPLRSLTPKMTRGCVVMSNLGILQVSKHISLAETPVAILSTIENVPLEENFRLRQEVFRLVSLWRDCRENRAFRDYLSCYSRDFRGADGWDLDRWGAHKKKIFGSSGTISVQLSIDTILRCRKYLVATFYQVYTSNAKRTFGKKALYLRRESGALKIIAERWSPVPVPEGWHDVSPGTKFDLAFDGGAAGTGTESDPRRREAPGKGPVNIGAYEATQAETADRVRFSFELQKNDGAAESPLDVRFAFVLRGEDEGGRAWYASYPPGVAKNSYFPENFTSCKKFTLSGTNRVEGEIRFPSAPPAALSGKVYIYRRDGILLTEKEIELSS